MDSCEDDSPILDLVTKVPDDVTVPSSESDGSLSFRERSNSQGSGSGQSRRRRTRTRTLSMHENSHDAQDFFGAPMSMKSNCSGAISEDLARGEGAKDDGLKVTEQEKEEVVAASSQVNTTARTSPPCQDLIVPTAKAGDGCGCIIL